MASPQAGRLHAGDNANFRCWLRVNGENVSDSNVYLTYSMLMLKVSLLAKG